LANPLCVCSAEQTAKPSPEISCCKPPTEDSGLPIAPCDCETAINEGLPMANEYFAKPQQPVQTLPVRLVLEHGLGTENLAPPVRHFDFRRPPLRHVLSVYRL
jgi:hypothetical protein